MENITPSTFIPKIVKIKRPRIKRKSKKCGPKGGDGVQEEIDPLDLHGRGLAGIVRGKAVRDRTDSVFGFDRGLEERKRHRRWGALHAFPVSPLTRRGFGLPLLPPSMELRRLQEEANNLIGNLRERNGSRNAK